MAKFNTGDVVRCVNTGDLGVGAEGSLTVGKEYAVVSFEDYGIANHPASFVRVVNDTGAVSGYFPARFELVKAAKPEEVADPKAPSPDTEVVTVRRRDVDMALRCALLLISGKAESYGHLFVADPTLRHSFVRLAESLDLPSAVNAVKSGVALSVLRELSTRLVTNKAA